MCLFRYRGYDVCSHEYPSTENQWEICFIGNQTDPRYCPLASFVRRKIGQDYCISCLDDTPPNHPPVTEIIQGFDYLRSLMEEIGSSHASRLRFTRDVQADLREIRDHAAVVGVNNNFYNDVKALYELYHHRIQAAIADAVARREARRSNEQGEGSATDE
ncbi:hypothetical protein F5Y01DRAFT_25116 [Xylaria sp. FL0043]|nr:hypothetical protein F5Y01DRAFT_25116 [Xylaria sp. FL0043]